METVKNGLFVSVDYTGTLDNGDVFDSSTGKQPLEIQMGQGQLIKGFEAALMGMGLNEQKKFTLPPEEAYGQKNDAMMHSFSRTEIPGEMNPRIGDSVALTTQDGQQVPARIVDVTDESVTVDMNHPMAGKALTFEIEVMGISKTATQEQGCGCGCDHSHGDDGCTPGDCSSGNC